MIILSKVISKIRCYNPSERNTVSGNVNHLSYIANRNMAVYNDNGVSTFGDIETIDVENTDIKELKKYISEIGKQKINIYRGIISMKEKDCLELGYDNQQTWKDMMNRNIYDIGKKLGLSMSGMEWIAVVHMKKDNPHIHYQLWDKKQTINRYFINVNTQEEIRKLLVKDIFDNELHSYYKLLDNSKENIKQNAILKEIKAFDNRYCNKKIAFLKNIKLKDLNKLLKLYNNIKNELPKTGSLKYEYMTKEIKQDINIFIKELMNYNVDLKNEYYTYIEVSKNIGKLYGEDNKKEMENKAIKQLDKILGNKFLNSIKEINKEKISNQVFINHIIQNLYSLLSILIDSNESKYDLYRNYKCEMSKQAKKDLAKNRANINTMSWY